MKLQVAFDNVDLEVEGLFEVLEQIYQYVDIIEIGTPMIMKYGSSILVDIKKQFTEKTLFADFKIMDAGYLEAKIAFDNGADIVSVMGVASENTISTAVDAAKNYGKMLMCDLMNVHDIEIKLNSLNYDEIKYFCVHRPSDMENKVTTNLNYLGLVSSLVGRKKLAVAGGISLYNISDILLYEPEVVIVGSSILNSKNINNYAKELKETFSTK